MNACSSRERVGAGRFCISSAIIDTVARAGAPTGARTAGVDLAGAM
jgi:hypothetical protein